MMTRAPNRSFLRLTAGVLALCLALPEQLVAQPAAPPPSAPAPVPAPAQAQAPQGQPQAQQQPVFRSEEIDQMTAPIALYPDDLVAQILMAATYPLEVAMADRWLEDPANAKLKGDELAQALEPQTWDPSVKSLVPFPVVLDMMSDKLDWTQRLGDAFLAQQADVMASIQRLRQQAQAAGNLKTTEQQTVVTEKETTTQKETIIIQPANPQVVYVPSYNPSVVYGTWPYPSYPPVYYPPPAAYYPVGTALVSGMAFATGAAIVGSLWGWGSCNWGHGDVNINSNRYNTINSNNIRSGRSTQLASNATTWRHDSSHRAGVAYRDAGTRQAYGRQSAGAGAANRDVRGYDGGQRAAGQARASAGGGAARANTARAGAGGGAAAGNAGRAGAGGGAAAANAGRAGAGGRAGQGNLSASRPNATAGAGSSRPQAAQRQPQAFQGVNNGAATRAQSDRGRASRSSMNSAPRASAGSSFSGARAGGGGARAGGGGGRRR